jgi:serine/threonine protein kinase
MDNRQPLQSGTIVGGDYRIESVLGAGGFGITYLAHDEKLGAKVALKEYFPASLAKREDGITIEPFQTQGGADYEWGLERFLAEARTLARLRHPNIVSVSRYFRENATAYMVLGFVEGQDFESWLQDLGRAPTQDELDAIVLPVLDALKTVHEADLVHRDLKPQNIYIRSDDSQPIVLDFGAARQALGEHSRATAAFVSPGYSPPESHLNDPTEQGPWTDIYSFAATLYRALVGRSPAQVLSRVTRDLYEPLANQLSHPDAYRRSFLAAIDAGMNVRREDRPQSVAAWRSMLMAHPEDAPTVVTPAPSSAEQQTRIISPQSSENAASDATRVVAASASEGTRRSASAPTRKVSNDSGPQSASSEATGARPPGNGLRWLWAAAATVVIIVGLINIYQSFNLPTQPDSSTPETSEITTATSQQTSSQATSTSDPATQSSGPTTQTTGPGTQTAQSPDRETTGADEVPNNGTLFAQDPSLRRLATASWLSSGLQDGYWTAVMSGAKGTGIYLRCRGAEGLRRDSIVELELIPTGNRPITGNHEVRAQIGTFTTNAVMTFNSANGFSNASVSMRETQADAGQFLNFLHQVFLGETMTVTIPTIGYQENFNLNGADEALNVCFGADMAQPWRAYTTTNGIAGGEVRNANGAALVVLCDTTPETRGNLIVAFGLPFNGTVELATKSIDLQVGTNSIAGTFSVRTRGGGLGGVGYNRVTDDNSRQQVRDLLNELRQSKQISLSSTDPSFSQTFPLNGSQQALAGCEGL